MTHPVQKFENASDANDYFKYRPSYPKQVVLEILNFLELGMEKPLYDHATGRCISKAVLAVDVGCGPGNQSTLALVDYFDQVVGVDVSKEQIRAAVEHIPPVGERQALQYKVCTAESLPLPDNSVTLIQAAAAAHWFNLPEFYKECDRVLTPGGVVAQFSYSYETEIIDHPKAEQLSELLLEIMIQPYELGYLHEANILSKDHYTAERIQIPYKDRVRVDDIPFIKTSSIENLFGFIHSLSYQRKMFETEGDKMEVWYKEKVDRFMEVYGSNDKQSQITYKKIIFMLIGRKPAADQL